MSTILQKKSLMIFPLIFIMVFACCVFTAKPAAAATKNPRIIFIGDSYAEGLTPDYNINPATQAFPALVSKMTGIKPYAAYHNIGNGFVSKTKGTNFSKLIDRAYKQTASPEKVEYLVIAGGLNDQYYSYSRIYNNAVSALKNAKSYFPNARIFVGMIGWSEVFTDMQSAVRNTVAPAYINAARAAGVTYITNSEYVLSSASGVFSSDYCHPSPYGQQKIAEHIAAFINKDMRPASQSSVSYITYKGKPGWWYVNGGKVDTSFNSLAPNHFGWWKITNGRVDFSYNGLAQNDVGLWKITNGAVDWNYNGLFPQNGTWYFLRNGLVDWSYYGLAQGWDRNWYFVNGGYIDWKISGLTCYNGGWFYVENGKVNWGANTLCQNDYGWWKVTNGMVDFSFTGFFPHNGTWYYLRNGSIDWGYYGLAQGWDGKWYFVNGGYLDRNVTGLAFYQGNWFYVRKGMLDWSYTGYATNPYGTWLVVNGVVRF